MTTPKALPLPLPHPNIDGDGLEFDLGHYGGRDRHVVWGGGCEYEEEVEKSQGCHRNVYLSALWGITTLRSFILTYWYSISIWSICSIQTTASSRRFIICMCQIQGLNV